MVEKRPCGGVREKLGFRWGRILARGEEWRGVVFNKDKTT